MSNNFHLTPTPAKRHAESVLGDTMIEMVDIARHLGVTYRTVQSWRQKGILPPPDFAIGKVVRWRRATIQVFVEGRSAGGGT